MYLFNNSILTLYQRPLLPEKADPNIYLIIQITSKPNLSMEIRTSTTYSYACLCH